MDTIIFDVATLHGFLNRAKAAAASGQPAHAARLSFPTPSRLLFVLSDRRVELLCTMMGADAMDARELARRVGRDVRAVRDDLAVLLDAGVIDRTDTGRVRFPYRHVKVQFNLEIDQDERARVPMMPSRQAQRAAPPSLR